jgi:NAD(P)-dependent dehydrogenase (short-subunit alcohol dehydrogenase family)
MGEDIRENDPEDQGFMSPPIIIFGAVGGIGEALARRLAEEGAPLFLTGRDGDRLDALARELGTRSAVCDVLAPEQIDAAIAEADTGEGIAGLAYCVGSIELKSLRSAKAEDYLDTFRLNTVGAAMAVKAARSALVKAGGSVVLFSTVAVAQGFPNHSVIASAKGGVEGLGRSLAAELAPDVRVNVIAPSLTRTGIAEPILGSDQMAQSIAKMHALPRLGDPDDIAAAAQFLLGPDSGWMTGQVVGIDGGRSALRTPG